ncbi:hypothetical protein KC887_00105 [Candidatus Kaiserbacteria bacterium]|nr:hypothetical protein [Candidatus Kaiserbacteria bacterium]
MYNVEQYPHYLKKAGKVTLFAAFFAVIAFLLVWSVDVGKQEFTRVSAQSATTTLTVLNTPPTFSTGAHEVIESSTSTPTNSGDVIQWAAVGNDSNDAPYFLLVCSTNATPTAGAASGPGNLGTAAPSCGAGATQWAVSPATPSDSEAVAATTTTEVAPFAQINNWYAWVCDDDPFNPRCSLAYSQGTNATNSSPFNVNRRPVLSGFSNNGPVDPGTTITFSSTSSDPDAGNLVYLVVCQTAGDYSTTTNTCTANFLASTTVGVTTNATAQYTLASIVRDGTFPAYGFLVDQYGHEALANPIQNDFVVNNVAPTVLGGEISLNGGNPISLTEPGGETTGFTLDFTIHDANSCVNAASSSEITSYDVAIFRSSYGTSTCDTTSGSYDPNYCYPSGAATTTWNLSCSQVPGSCTGPTDDSVDFTCTFPLWFVADPTDSGPNTPALFAADVWTAAVAGTDDNALTGNLTTTASPVELFSFTALNLLTASIPYGPLEPGDNSGTLNASTTIQNYGNTGLDQEVQGESMCGTFAVGNDCPVSATSTIPENQQQFSSTSLAYNSPLAVILSSSTPNEVELNIRKSTVPALTATGTTWWGIAVPITITLAGNYQGLNTFSAVTAESVDW